MRRGDGRFTDDEKRPRAGLRGGVTMRKNRYFFSLISFSSLAAKSSRLYTAV
jgi:hypothetical protein